MMCEILRFIPEDIIPLIEEPMNESLKDWFSSGRAEVLQKDTMAFTVFYNDEPVLCFGVMRLWGMRGYMWGVFSENVKHCSVTVYRKLRKLINEQPYFDRIEMDTPVDNDLISRRALFWGFKLEIPTARKYSPSGSDRSLFAWVRE